MLGKTHMAAALCVAFLLIKKLHPQNQILFIIITVFFSLIPDIDTTKSILGKYVKPIGWIFNHRGFFHSLLLAVIIYILFFKYAQEYALAALVGFLSHLCLDALTHQGEQFFWPSKLKLPGIIKTGGIIETVFFVALVVVNAWLILLI